MDKFDFNCNQLKNAEVPAEWINKALEIPSTAPKVKPYKRFYRYAAGIAACVVLAAAVMISVMFGLNKNVNLTIPIEDSTSKTDSGYSESKPNSTDNTSPSDKSSVFSETDNSNTDFISEPSENNEVNRGPDYEAQSSRASNNKENKSQKTTKPTKENTKQAETSPETTGENPEPAEEKETVNIKMIDTDDWAIGALPDDSPKPTRPSVSEVNNCRFLVSADRSIAEGKTYYCRVEDESGKLLGGGTAQKYDWGNSDWPLDVKYTADFVLYYEHNYTVTFYDSAGETLWSGMVYLQQGKDYYLLY